MIAAGGFGVVPSPGVIISFGGVTVACSVVVSLLIFKMSEESEALAVRAAFEYRLALLTFSYLGLIIRSLAIFIDD